MVLPSSQSVLSAKTGHHLCPIQFCFAQRNVLKGTRATPRMKWCECCHAERFCSSSVVSSRKGRSCLLPSRILGRASTGKCPQWDGAGGSSWWRRSWSQGDSSETSQHITSQILFFMKKKAILSVDEYLKWKANLCEWSVEAERVQLGATAFFFQWEADPKFAKSFMCPSGIDDFPMTTAQHIKVSLMTNKEGFHLSDNEKPPFFCGWGVLTKVLIRARCGILAWCSLSWSRQGWRFYVTQGSRQKNRTQRTQMAADWWDTLDERRDKCICSLKFLSFVLGTLHVLFHFVGGITRPSEVWPSHPRARGSCATSRRRPPPWKRSGRLASQCTKTIFDIPSHEAPIMVLIALKRQHWLWASCCNKESNGCLWFVSCDWKQVTNMTRSPLIEGSWKQSASLWRLLKIQSPEDLLKERTFT